MHGTSATCLLQNADSGLNVVRTLRDACHSIGRDAAYKHISSLFHWAPTHRRRKSLPLPLLPALFSSISEPGT